VKELMWELGVGGGKGRGGMWGGERTHVGARVQLSSLTSGGLTQ